MEQNQKIDRILEIGRTVKSADPNPYLFNKIVLRLKDKAEETYRTNPALVWVSMSTLTILIAVNIYMLTNRSSAEKGNEMNTVVEAYGINNQGGLNYE